MAADLDAEKLRGLVAKVAIEIADSGTHSLLPEEFRRVGLPVPTEDGTKTERARRSVAAVPTSRLPEIAQSMIDYRAVESGTRNAIQDVLWAAETVPDIPKRTRREIARALDLDTFLPAYSQFKAMLDELWDIRIDPSGGFGMTDTSLGGEIDQHVYRNPGDWDAEYLFTRLGAFDALSKRFALFLEGLVSAETLPDEAAQRDVVSVLNPHLNNVGLRLLQTGEADGYPVFHLTSTRAHGGRPKNLIFATLTKPDLRFSDLLDSEIESLSDADQVLVYASRDLESHHPPVPVRVR